MGYKMKKQFLFISLSLMFSVAAQAELQRYTKTMKNGGTVSFVKESGMTAEEFSRSPYQLKPDPAWLEKNFPLTNTERQNITAQDLDQMTQEEVDQIYVRSRAGRIVPDSYAGTVMIKDGLLKDGKNTLFKNSRMAAIAERFCRSFGKTDLVECLSELAWKGKRIYPVDSNGQYQLRNAISIIASESLKYALMPFTQAASPKNWLLRTTELFNGSLKYMLFPAKVYCGQSLLDSRRESIIIDYAWGDEFTPFIRGIDDLAGRGYMDIRDEVRAVRPGLYLGRAYTNKIFLLNFTLTSATQIASAGQNTASVDGQCFSGTTTR